jgi:hypothetical protein
MTDKEKLDKAVEFIRWVEAMQIDCYGSLSPYCYKEKFEQLKDRAWHVLADLSE